MLLKLLLLLQLLRLLLLHSGVGLHRLRELQGRRLVLGLQQLQPGAAQRVVLLPLAPRLIDVLRPGTRQQTELRATAGPALIHNPNRGPVPC